MLNSKEKELENKFKAAESKNKRNRDKHDRDFSLAKKNVKKHHNSIEDRLNKFIPNRNK